MCGCVVSKLPELYIPCLIILRGFPIIYTRITGEGGGGRGLYIGEGRGALREKGKVEREASICMYIFQNKSDLVKS